MSSLPVSPSLLAAAAGGCPLLLRQLFDADTGTFTYLLADGPSGEGVLIDPVYEQHPRDLSLIQELGIRLVASLDTHAHADHVTGSWRLHAATGCAIALAAAVGAENVTIPLAHGDRVAFGARYLEVRSTPGHTDGCLTYVLDDQSCARGARGRSPRRFPGGRCNAATPACRSCCPPGSLNIGAASPCSMCAPPRSSLVPTAIWPTAC